MNVNLARMKTWDWGIVGAFVLIIVGVSIPWWRIADAGNISGWHIGAGKAAFSFSLFAFVWVLAKILLPAHRPLPKWYMESWPVMVFGAVCVLCGLVGTVDKPGAGLGAFGEAMGIGDPFSWRPGALIVLLVGLGMVFCGYMMLKDKSGEYGESKMPKITTNAGAPAGYQQPPVGYQPPAAPPAGGKFCSNCGAGLAPEDAACRACGKPV